MLMKLWSAFLLCAAIAALQAQEGEPLKRVSDIQVSEYPIVSVDWIPNNRVVALDAYSTVYLIGKGRKVLSSLKLRDLTGQFETVFFNLSTTRKSSLVVVSTWDEFARRQHRRMQVDVLQCRLESFCRVRRKLDSDLE